MNCAPDQDAAFGLLKLEQQETETSTMPNCAPPPLSPLSQPTSPPPLPPPCSPSSCFTQEEENALVGLRKLQEEDYCCQCSYHGGVEMLVRCQFFSLYVTIFILQQKCSVPSCKMLIHPLCCGVQLETQCNQQRVLCPCCNTALDVWTSQGSSLRTDCGFLYQVGSVVVTPTSKLRYIACLVETCHGDSDSFGIWVG
jgi:hypothetical protein